MARAFAVDLGAWSVKVAVATPGLRSTTLTHVYERRVPPGDDPAEQRARAALAQLIGELRLGDDAGYLGVYGDQVFTQILEFGFKSLRRAELDKAVGAELESVVPVDLEDMVYCFEPIPPLPAKAAPIEGEVPASPAFAEVTRGRVAAPADGMRVLTYAMRQDRAQALIQLGDAAGFHPRGILACAGAAIRLVERTPSLARARGEGPVAVIDIGHDRTDLVVVSNGKAVFSRSIARAGRHVTEAIARNWKLSFADAEQAKHAEGRIASAAEPATSDQWARVHEVLATELNPFARDLRQTLAACRARTGFAAIAAIVVGGGSRLGGIGAFLSEQLGVPTWRLTSDDIVALAGPKLGAEAMNMPIDSAALTVGMIYDAAGGRPQFDLRSGNLAMRVDLSFLRAKAVPLGAAVVAVAACAAGAAYAHLYALKKAESTMSTRLAEETTQHFGAAKTADEVLDAARTGSAAAAGTSPMPRMSAYDVLLAINEKLPPRDKITLDIERLTIDDQRVDIQGSAKDGPEIDLLVTQLKTIDCFKDVSRGPTETGENGVKKFKLTITASCM